MGVGDFGVIAVMDRHGKATGNEPPSEPGAGDQAGERHASERDWVHELIAMTRPGVEIEFPLRGVEDRVIPFVYDDFD